MIIFKPYVSIVGFLQRYTLLKVGNLHIRVHKITDRDKTTLFHNHPFNYISIVLKNGYTEVYIDDNGNHIKIKHKRFAIIKRKHNIYHRIDDISGETITLFITYGKYKWNAFNTEDVNDFGIYQRIINGKVLWCKKENGIWFIGHTDKSSAEYETRHSIHQLVVE